MKRILPFLFAYIGWENTDGQQESQEAYEKSEELYAKLLTLIPQEARPVLMDYVNSITRQDFAFYCNDLEMAARICIQLYRELLEPVDFQER